MNTKLDNVVPGKPEEGLVPHHFEGSGKMVFVKKSSPVLMMELRKKYPPPLPPQQPVDYGDDVGVVMEYNESHPEYRQALQDHENLLEEKMRQLLIKRSVVLPAEQLDAIKAEVKELQDDWAEITGEDGEESTELKGSLEYLYVSYICIAGEQDLNNLIGVITGTSFRDGEGSPGGDPAPEADVQGEATIQGQD